MQFSSWIKITIKLFLLEWIKTNKLFAKIIKKSSFIQNNIHTLRCTHMLNNHSILISLQNLVKLTKDTENRGINFNACLKKFVCHEGLRCQDLEDLALPLMQVCSHPASKNGTFSINSLDTLLCSYCSFVSHDMHSLSPLGECIAWQDQMTAVKETLHWKEVYELKFTR